MADENPEHVVQNTLQRNVAAFESIYEKSWDKREDLAKLLITLSSTFLVAVASVVKLFYRDAPVPGYMVIFLVFLLVPVLFGCISLWILADLRGLKVAAFDKRHRSKEVFDACFAGDEPTIVPFTSLVTEVLHPAVSKDRKLTVVLTIGYVAFFVTLLLLVAGLVLEAVCSNMPPEPTR